MRHKLTESYVRSLPFKSPSVRDTEVKGFMVLCHKQSTSYAIQGDIWRNKRKIKCVRITIGRTDRIPLRQARAQARELMGRISRGEDPSLPRKTSALTLRKVWDLREKAGGLSPKTVREYQGHLQRYMKKWMDIPLVELGTNRRVVREQHEWITKKHGRYAANHALRTLRTLYNWALREDPSLPTNPTAAVAFHKEEKRNWAMAKSDLPEWMENVQRLSPILRDLQILLLFTGLRRLDACSASWNNFDPVRGVLHIPTPKGGATRAFDLPLSDYLCNLLERRREENELLFPNSRWIFPAFSKAGHVIEPKKNGLPSAHAYRHTYRTLALEAGIPYTETCLLLNHKLQDVSFGYVSRHALVDHLKEQQERMTAFLLDACQSIDDLLM